jgi:hypothetical protein
LVEVQPSTVTALKLSATPACSAVRSAAGSTAASVVSTASIVAMLGASIAAPLAMPPTTNPSPHTMVSLRRVSVVMIASAAAMPWAGPAPRAAATAGMPAASASMGSS